MAVDISTLGDVPSRRPSINRRTDCPATPACQTFSMPSLILRILSFAACLCAFPSAATADEHPQAIDFVHDVVPILQRNCVHCHGGREAEGGFSLNTRSDLLDSGYVESGDPDASHLLELVASADPDLQMPPSDRPRVSGGEIKVLRRWVESGLPWDADFTFEIQTYEPPLRPRTPLLPVAVDGRNHPIDRILDAYLDKQKLPRPEPIEDHVFLRRASLDLIGLLPSREQLDCFVEDADPHKRERMIEQLLRERVGYADHWMTFFNDLLRNDYSGTGFITGGRKQISKWLYASLLENKPFDQMARELIAPPTEESQGYIDGIKWRGEVSAGQTLPIQFSQSISQSFLGINMKCASCHDSFVDHWTLRDAYGLAAIYADETLELHRCDKPTGESAEAAWLFPELGQVDPNAPRAQRLQQLAELMTHPENGRFARTIVNRLWYCLMGRGIVHPLDSMKNEPWSEDLLDYLASDLIANHFDLKSTLRRIATSAAYQSRSEVVDGPSSSGDYVYRGPRARRMTAEQFLDSVWRLTGDAPLTFDAPVVRSRAKPDASAQLSLTAQWIWGPLTNGTVPGNQTVTLRKMIDLREPVVKGGAVITCDNRYQLFVNQRLVSRSDDWTKPQSVALAKHLEQGKNLVEVIVTNDTDKPNPAGLFFEARLELADHSRRTIKSDATWEYSDQVPTPHDSSFAEDWFDDAIGSWHSATVVPAVASWTREIEKQGPSLLAAAISGSDLPMVRTSLLKNTALMKSLGRPMREQIVSMRPDTITTLEAIDLSNEPTLAGSFASGAERLLDESNGDSDRMIDWLYQAALSREPTADERSLLRAALGEDPDETVVQDVMWAVCMLPEFLTVR